MGRDYFTVYIAICDDEQYMSDKIHEMVSDFFRKKHIEITTVQFPNGEELLKYDKTIDILFLDIQMGGMNGMETARRLRARKFKGILIFITILKEMVFQAFDVTAYDYLIKPIEESQFKKTMERLITSMQNANEANLFVQKGHESYMIAFEDIVFCEVIDRKIYLHLISSSVIDFYERMDKLEKKLDNRFFRCHRSFIINLKYLKSFKNGFALMEGGKEIPVSRSKSREFSNVILQYMKKWRP